MTLGFKVTGRVQGVGFRWWVRQRGREAGLAGSVWNCSDGSVELNVRGPSVAAQSFGRLMSEGPPGSAVRAVVECPASVAVAWGDFRIGAGPGGA